MPTPSRTSTVFRLHPTINFARVGTSDDFYLSPDTSAGLPVDGREDLLGGLPIRRGTEDEPIGSDDLRDEHGHLLRQAARFRIFAYGVELPDRYPSGGGTEVVPGTRLADGREVADIIWTVHVANKKANAYDVVPSQGLQAYAGGKVPGLRNPSLYGTVDTPQRLQQLMIDPGPRAIGSVAGGTVGIDLATTPSYSDGRGGIAEQPAYPVAFPCTIYGQLFQPSGPLDSLGELRTDERGRLLVLAGHGRTAAIYDEYGDPMPLTGDLNNDGWFDDAADGPVSATIVFTDNTTVEAFGAWVVCGDPAYAPQIRNVVSVWDDVYDAWVRGLDLQPEICRGGEFQPDYRPSFAADIHPVFRAASLQRWTANLPELAVRAHDAVGAIAAADDPDRTIMSGLAYVRNPNVDGELSVGVPLMPLSLGEAGTDFLAVSRTQYFFLEQWSRGHFDPDGPCRLGPGEYLDMASLSNCLGGRYVPGIELSYPIRQPDLYDTDWRDTGCGPFRIRHQPLDYGAASRDTPFLSGGWIPLHDMTDGLQPGDLSKFMSVPWQTDYNSCSIHQPSINTSGRNTAIGNPTTLYWSWPSQRPDAVYPATAVVNGVLPARVWSIRGPGTLTNDPKTAATFQKALQSVQQWDRIGVVLQGSVISGGRYPAGFFLEAESRLPTEGQSVNVVAEWPFNANPPVVPH
ncbi:MAG TPA: LodA/GoxA family CTQ-dependent oxidase [Microlunatus sp.]|nr:LodA/GoxA family CTQ-dependent oxidase [Microlunatus sp.]